jgi:hypothetical protein
MRKGSSKSVEETAGKPVEGLSIGVLPIIYADRLKLLITEIEKDASCS